MIYAVKKYCPPEQHYEEYIAECVLKMSGSLQKNISKWLLGKGDNGYKLYSVIKDI